MIAKKRNKTALRIAWQQERPSLKVYTPFKMHPPLKMIPPPGRKSKVNGPPTKRQQPDPAFEKCKMPKEPAGYIKAPRYEFF